VQIRKKIIKQNKYPIKKLIKNLKLKLIKGSIRKKLALMELNVIKIINKIIEI
jgi:hypothetical protein